MAELAATVPQPETMIAGPAPRTGSAARLREMLSATLGHRSTIRRDALIAFVVRAASAAVLYLSHVLLARWMGSFEYGIFVLVWTWVLILGGLSTLGLSTAMMQMLPALREVGDNAQARGLLLGARLMGLGCASLVAMLGLLLLAVFGDALESHMLLPACLALVCVPLATLTDLQDGIGRANGWLAIALLPPYVLRPLLLLVAMAVAHLGGIAMSAPTATGCAILATWTAALVQTLLVQRRIRTKAPKGSRTFAPARWLGVSLPLLAFLACEVTLQNVDVLVISRYLSPTEVAVYFAGAKTMSLVLFVHYAVGSAVANKISALGARNDRAGLVQCVRDAVNWTFWPSLVGALLLLALGPFLLALFGPGFASGYVVMLVLAVGFLARAAVGPSEFLLNMLGEQKLSAAVLGATTAASVALSLLLVPHFGIVGAAVANAAALIGGSMLNAMVARRRLGLEVAIWRNWQPPVRSPRPL